LPFVTSPVEKVVVTHFFFCKNFLTQEENCFSEKKVQANKKIQERKKVTKTFLIF